MVAPVVVVGLDDISGLSFACAAVTLCKCVECATVGAAAVREISRVHHRTPEALLTTISTVLDTYDSQLGSQGMLADGAALMNPAVIKRLRALQTAIRKSYG